MARVKVRPWQYILAAVAIGLVVLVLIWNWDWFIPIADRMASAKLGRPVVIRHLHIRLAANPVLEVDGLTIGNPPGFPQPGPFANIDQLAVTLDGPAYLHGQIIVVPSIKVNKPTVIAVALPDGQNNWTFPFGGAPSGGKPGSSAKIGDLRIVDGHVHAVDPKFKADFHLDIATRDAAGAQPAQLVVTAHGTYANQPINGRFVGGTLLTLRDKNNPYPIDLIVENGATRLLLKGTVEDPLAFAGTNLKVDFTGKNMENLTPLIGVPAPETPPYRLTGDLAYADKKFKFDNLVGYIGNSDIEGSVAIDPGPERPVVDVDFRSQHVDLTDLGGFIGGTPGRAGTANETPEQRTELAHAAASPYLIPRTPLNMPRLHAADVNLKFHGEHITGRSIPLDDVIADMTIKDGAIRLHPLSFGVGRGRIIGDIAADPTGAHDIHARTHIEFHQVDLARLLSATHTFAGAGTLGGQAEIDGTGNSLGGILGAGNGDIKLFMTGGNLSALLVALSGLEFGNALLSALGVPQKTDVRCLVSDFALQNGLLNTRTLLLDTEEANVTGKGYINLRDEAIDYQLSTEAKHFTIGSLPAPIDITGHLKHPSIMPDPKDMAIRGGLAVGLGVLLTPLAALLPTIQLGLGENNNCGELIRNARSTPNPADLHGQAHPPAVSQP